MIEVFAVGSAVMLHGDIPASVLSISIRSVFDVDYKVVWWDGRNRKEEWVDHREVDAVGQNDTFKIGFK